MKRLGVLEKKVLDTKVKEIEKIVNEGKNVDEIANALGRHKIWVYQTLRKAGKKIVKHKALADRSSGEKKDLMEEIDKLLRSGYEMSEIAKIVNVPIGGIYTTIAMAGKHVVVTGQELVDIEAEAAELEA